MTRSGFARTFLGLNAAFSLFTGLACLLAARSVADVLFASPADWQATVIRLLGVGLLVFAIDLLLMVANKHVTKTQIQLICLADLGWVAVSAGVLTFADFLFSSSGVIMILVVAGLVAVFAVGQFVGARSIVPSPAATAIQREGRTLVASVKRSVEAPVDAVWQVMIDHPAYADVADNIAKVEVVSGQGLGMKRKCYGLKGESWSETCDIFEDGHLFGFKIHTDAPDYPYPFAELSGRWSVVPNEGGSAFSIVIHATLKGNWLMRTFFLIVGTRQFQTILIDLADAWAARMKIQAGVQTSAHTECTQKS